MTEIADLMKIPKFEHLIGQATGLIRKLTPEQTEDFKELLNHDACDLGLSDAMEIIFYLGMLNTISTLGHLNPAFILMFSDEITALTVHGSSHIDRVMYRHEMEQELKPIEQA